MMLPDSTNTESFMVLNRLDYLHVFLIVTILTQVLLLQYPLEKKIIFP